MAGGLSAPSSEERLNPVVCVQHWDAFFALLTTAHHRVSLCFSIYVSLCTSPSISRHRPPVFTDRRSNPPRLAA